MNYFSVKKQAISTSADGAPHSRVCARKTLCSASPSTLAEIFWHTYLQSHLQSRGRPKLGKPGTYQEQGSVLFLKNQEPTNNRNLLVLQETSWFTRKLLVKARN